jgi:hypothetical protein
MYGLIRLMELFLFIRYGLIKWLDLVLFSIELL